MLTKCFQDFLEYFRVVKNASKHTLRNYAIDLNAFHFFLKNMQGCPKEPISAVALDDNQSLNQVIKIKDIDRKMIRGFLAQLTFDKQSKRTIARRLSSLRSFFKYALQHHLITTNPTEDLQSPKLDHSLPNFLSYEQISHFLEQPDLSTYLGLRDRTMMELFYSSGIRLSELIGLNRIDIDFIQLTIKLRGKGKKERIIPITHNASRWISSYLNHADRQKTLKIIPSKGEPEPIFLNKFGLRLSTRSVDRLFNQYLVQSGIASKVTPHIIRHTTATHLLENGMDLKNIQILLGHSALSTTTIYTQVSSKLKKKVYDKTHPRA